MHADTEISEFSIEEFLTLPLTVAFSLVKGVKTYGLLYYFQSTHNNSQNK
jgi:hypothetical protein